MNLKEIRNRDRVEEIFSIVGNPLCDRYKLEDVDLEYTRETLEDFLNAWDNWREGDLEHEYSDFLHFEKVQPRKGDQRCELTVIDCGDFRIVCKW